MLKPQKATQIQKYQTCFFNVEFQNYKTHISKTKIYSAPLISRIGHGAITVEIQKYNKINLRNREIQ